MIVKVKIVRNARLKKEFSQEYLAHILMISQSKYSRLEKGEISFNIDELSMLIDVLELNPFEVLDFTAKQQVFINSFYSVNINSKLNNINIETICELIQEKFRILK
jgi:transcriptional regulator with XRE-family HTH domain